MKAVVGESRAEPSFYFSARPGLWAIQQGFGLFLSPKRKPTGFRGFPITDRASLPTSRPKTPRSRFPKTPRFRTDAIPRVRAFRDAFPDAKAKRRRETRPISSDFGLGSMICLPTPRNSPEAAYGARSAVLTPKLKPNEAETRRPHAPAYVKKRRRLSAPVASAPLPFGPPVRPPPRGGAVPPRSGSQAPHGAPRLIIRRRT